jgi:hypothetical protein
MAYVYGHYKADTGELFYIGKGSDTRAWKKNRRNQYWKNIVNRHGFVVKIIYDDLTHDEAYDKEKELITEIGLENLANFQIGGRITIDRSDETRAKISKAFKGKPLSEEHRRKIGAAHKNRAKTEAHRKKLSDALKNRKFSEESLKKMSESRRNKKLTVEHRKNISKAVKGNSACAWNKGKKLPPLSEEHRKKISEAHKRRQLDNP